MSVNNANTTCDEPPPAIDNTEITLTEANPIIVPTPPSPSGHQHFPTSVIYLLLCTFSLFYLMDPSSPFFVQYLMKEKHISIDTVIIIILL